MYGECEFSEADLPTIGYWYQIFVGSTGKLFYCRKVTLNNEREVLITPTPWEII